MTDPRDSCDILIVGAGPAGTSAAIHLAKQGIRVLLLEQTKFPRAKLCGEFISPECQKHFDQLGVANPMLEARGATLNQTIFYSQTGRSVTVPTEWFGNNATALGLSRAEMDMRLLDRAKSLGVRVLEDTHVSEPIVDRKRVRGVRLKSNGHVHDYSSRMTIDATGRTRALARKFDGWSMSGETKRRPHLVAFKAHLKDTRGARGVCEIYSYQGGYGGLNEVEGGVSNFCFIVSAETVRLNNSDPETVIRNTVFKNPRAAHTLADSKRSTDWLSVSLERFGRHKLVPIDGLLTIGDAAAFIDPFTGSGMLMALESGKLVAQTIIEHFEAATTTNSFAMLANDYRSRYHQKFDSRLRICGLLRRVAFSPWLAEAAILIFGTSARLRHKVARATRPSLERKASASRDA